MSLRSKANELKSAGAARRGTFEPSGAPKRMYDYWLNNSDSLRAAKIRYGMEKENFCHYWRVVFLWGPLNYLVNKVTEHFERVFITLGALALTVFLGMFFVLDGFAGIVLTILTILVALGLGTFGVLSGVSAALTPESRRRYGVIEDRRAIVLGFVLGLPTALIAYGITKTSQFVSSRLAPVVERNKKTVAIASIAVVLGIIETVAILTGGFTTALWLALGIATGVIGVTLIILGAVLAEDYVTGLELKRRDERERFYEENGFYPIEEKKPSRIGKFFRGIGDFLVLIAQVVRVNKWKICPIVEIDSGVDKTQTV